ncbi:uncharacterized protein G2W53_017694 [Senna tora]|uniref:Uncharacterized protein n=1 Tax=Senna tora TaxID=362788 RepID=A0A834TQS0_9FABA|nr:uncharacterized protein G2W53_017694 [Senna tora]
MNLLISLFSRLRRGHAQGFIKPDAMSAIHLKEIKRRRRERSEKTEHRSERTEHSCADSGGDKNRKITTKKRESSTDSEGRERKNEKRAIKGGARASNMNH